jgi:hypothetical protein
MVKYYSLNIVTEGEVVENKGEEENGPRRLPFFLTRKNIKSSAYSSRILT